METTCKTITFDQWFKGCAGMSRADAAAGWNAALEAGATPLRDKGLGRVYGYRFKEEAKP